MKGALVKLNIKLSKRFVLVEKVVVVLSIIAIVTVSYQGTKYEDGNLKNPSFIEQKIGSFEPSSGNLYGAIYSLDGVPMLQSIDLLTGDNLLGKDNMSSAKIYSATQSYFAPIIGYDYIAEELSKPGRWGFIADSNIQDILLSNARFANKQLHMGNSIVTTIYSPAQEEAMEQLEEFSSLMVNESVRGTIAVVNQDGAILVNAALLPAEQMMFQNATNDYIDNSENIRYYTPNYNAFSPVVVGSSFKPLTARILEQKDDLLPEEWSVYQSDFDDYSKVTIDGINVENWEMLSEVNPSQYYTNFDGERYHRESDLTAALINSSNTYFLRHANELGLNKYKQYLNNLLHLYEDYDTGGVLISGLEPYQKDKFQSEDAYDVSLPFGSSAKLSPIRLASAYNHALGGQFYLPFEIAQIRDPKGSLIFENMPLEHEEYRLPVSVTDDILVAGMSDTFKSYLESVSRSPNVFFEEFSEELLLSGRILAKSGTVAVNTEHENRTMAVTLLNEEKTAVICTAVISLEHVPNNSVTNLSLIYKLLQTIEKLGVY